MADQIPLYRPHLVPADLESVEAALTYGSLCGGPWEARFEELVQEIIGARYAIAVSSASTGIYLTLLSLGVKAGDEIIMTPMNEIGSANAVEATGARVVFVDIDNRTQGMDTIALEEAITERTKVIIAPQPYGAPAAVDRVAAVAQSREIPLIEEAFASLGTVYKAKPLGAWGRVSVICMNETRALSIGAGGVVVTDDDRVAASIRSRRHCGLVKNHEDELCPNPRFSSFGTEARMTTMQAALGITQLERLEDIRRKRQQMACWYVDKLMEFPDLMLPKIHDEIDPVWPSFTIRLSSGFQRVNRDRIITGMQRHEIVCAPGLAPIHLQSYYKNKYMYNKGDFPMAESMSNRGISLPFFEAMELTHVELVALTLKVMLQRENLLLQPEKPASSNMDDEPPLRRD